MADDGLTNEQLLAELRQARAEIATLRADADARERALAESLEQQTATAEILRVIASSPTDPESVLQAIAESAVPLLGANRAAISTVEDGYLKAIAQAGAEGPYPWTFALGDLRPITRSIGVGRAILTG